MSRRAQIERMLSEDPQDSFLRYALALELAKQGEVQQAIAGLTSLIADQPAYVAAYFQAGQLLASEGRLAEARQFLTDGIRAARKIGDAHAAEEMSGLILQLGEA